jgi:hypothetical protein
VKNYRVLVAPDTLTLGECLNLCVAASAGVVLATMDDVDYYAPNYLVDLLHALSYSRADVVGKQSHYVHSASSRATVLRAPQREHRFSSRIMGPTIMARREVFQAHPFEARSLGQDTAFLESVAAAMGSIYAADRFNYCRMRSGIGRARGALDDDQAAHGEIQIFGNPREHLTL